jgi:cell wall-associated NlpC family hydrolase
LRLRFLSAVICSLTILLVCACGALAATTGGVVAGGTTTTTTTTAAPGATKPALHLFPVTSHSRSVAYHGPVYQRTATGEVVPYQPAAPAPAGGQATTGTAASATGGSAPAGTTTVAPITPGVGAPKPQLLVPGSTARYVQGLAAAPMNAPLAVQEIIWAGNQLIGLPYIFGGGHASFIASGYDCSGTVSFALHGAALLSSPKDSSEFETWGSHGIGRWVSIFSNPGHAYMTVAGLRLDTSAADDPSAQQGPRWRPLRAGNGGFVVRHPLGL